MSYQYQYQQESYRREDVRLPFGKFAGRKLCDPNVEIAYLVWLSRLPNLQVWLLRAIDDELERRDNENPQQDADYQKSPYIPQGVNLATAASIISAGRRSLALKHHPDVGGNNLTMAELNSSADFLSQYVATLCEIEEAVR